LGWRLRRKIYNLWSGESNTDGKTLGKNLQYCDRRRELPKEKSGKEYISFITQKKLHQKSPPKSHTE